MPIYEYSCEKCHKVFEEWTRKVDDNVSQTCPDCGGSAHRIVSNTSFVLKGGGWYVTEYGNRKGASASSGSTEPTSSNASTASTGTDSAAPAQTGSTPAASAPSSSPASSTAS